MKDNIRIYDLDLGITDNEPKAVALGYFDGVHKGHQKLMKSNIAEAEEAGLTPAVLLFKDDSKLELANARDHLTSNQDKIDIIAGLGIETFCLIDFNEDFRNLTSREFINEILIDKLNAKLVTIGEDYRFGKDAMGDRETLEYFEDEYSYITNVVDFEKAGDEKISSRDINSLLKAGEVNEANSYLGRPYRIKGEVVTGFQRGRTLNFPTANLDMAYPYVVPADGVYLTRVYLDDEVHFALTNIGTNPTFENIERKIETYILDFDRDIYGKIITIEFLEFFRGDVKFNSVDELIEQMEKDKKLAYETIKNKYL